MEGNLIPIGENTTLIVKASGDLFLRGEEALADVRFFSGDDRIHVQQSNGTLYIATHANLDLEIPNHVKVIVEKVGGSAFVQGLNGQVTIQKVGGDLALQNLATVRIEKVGGNCLAEAVNEGFFAQKIGGDLVARMVNGPVRVETVGGEGDLQIISGQIEARASGDLRVYVSGAVDSPLSLRAGGDLALYIPQESSIAFALDSGEEQIRISLASLPGSVGQTIESRRHDFVLGEGGQKAELRAGGSVDVSDAMIDPEPITAEFERREAAWLDSRDRHSHTSWTGGYGFDRTSAWADMISRRAQEAARRAEQRAQSAMRRTEEQIRIAAERDIRRAEFRGIGPFPPPAPPQPSQPVSEKERLMVLQMLQDNKITVEQAEMLLSALEGRSGR